MTAAAVDWWASELRHPFPGVYLTGYGVLTPQQRRLAATLTTPATHLGLHSAAACWSLVDDRPQEVTVLRHGDQGIVRSDGLVVRHSLTLAGNVVCSDGVWTTTPERTLIDLWPLLPVGRAQRLAREVLRTQLTTPTKLLKVIGHHRGRRGIVSLRAYVQRYSHLQFHRCRSAAEAFALVVLDDAGVEIPLVNVRIHGEEADLIWLRTRDIVEIDGPQYHRLTAEDARKTAIWEAAGFRVRRLLSTRLFADPPSLLHLAPPPWERQERRT